VIVCLLYKSGGTPEVDVWSDSFALDTTLLKDATNQHGPPPNGYQEIVMLAWFQIPANETDLDNTTINVLQVT
jgi:hypothetical protein